MLSDDEDPVGEVVAALTVEGTGYVGLVSSYEEGKDYREIELENATEHQLVGSNNYSPWYRSDGDEEIDQVTLFDTPIEEEADLDKEIRYVKQPEDWEIERHLRGYEAWTGGQGRQGEITEFSQ